MTAEEFLDRRHEFPEGGQWSELEAGDPVHFQPPDLDHGTVVLNLSKAFAESAHADDRGYACFDLGLKIASNPDTVRFPAACYFDTGPRFAESDREITSTVPALVVEIASTADRRRLQTVRTRQYLEWGVSLVWTIDPREMSVQIARRGQPVRTLSGKETLTGGSPSPTHFAVEVAALFAAPDWWSGPSRSDQ